MAVRRDVGAQIRNAGLAVALYAVAAFLPFLFFENRTELLHCRGGFDYQHCVAGDAPGALLIFLGLVVRPPDMIQIEGIYARRGYSGLMARIGGIASPFLLSCIAVYFSVRAVRRPKAVVHKQ